MVLKGATARNATFADVKGRLDLSAAKDVSGAVLSGASMPQEESTGGLRLILGLSGPALEGTRVSRVYLTDVEDSIFTYRRGGRAISGRVGCSDPAAPGRTRSLPSRSDRSFGLLRRASIRGGPRSTKHASGRARFYCQIHCQNAFFGAAALFEITNF